MKEKENIQKIIIAMIQTVVVYFSASLTLTLITPNFKSNKDLLFVLLIHYIVFYLSDFYRDFWSRGYLEEFKMVLKYSFYYIFISSSLFFIFKNSFTTTRLSFFPFIAMNSILLYLLNSFLKYYRKYSYAKFSRDTKVVLITNKDSLSKMTFKNKYDHNYIAVCILDSSEKDCYDLKHNSLRIINKDALTSELTCLTVDQAFINIPIELFGKYQIQDIINDIEAMGAEVIEKHFTLDTNMEGPDHKASATPDILAALVKGVRIVEQALGRFEKIPDPVEEKNKIVARKSVVALKPIKKGDIYSIENITVKRPGNGISPMNWYDILGQEAQDDFEEDEVIRDSRFENQLPEL
ncbi:TPA: N-acetylneuraminate synthase family protein [Streptococcus agalactiae]